jgi:hypothetical protein
MLTFALSQITLMVASSAAVVAKRARGGEVSIVSFLQTFL